MDFENKVRLCGSLLPLSSYTVKGKPLLTKRRRILDHCLVEFQMQYEDLEKWTKLCFLVSELRCGPTTLDILDERHKYYHVILFFCPQLTSHLNMLQNNSSFNSRKILNSKRIILRFRGIIEELSQIYQLTTVRQTGTSRKKGHYLYDFANWP